MKATEKHRQMMVARRARQKERMATDPEYAAKMRENSGTKKFTLCECGAPSHRKREERINSPLAHGCERCLKIEADMNHVKHRKTVGVEDQAVIPAGVIAQINRACTAWLRARGLASAVGHYYVIEEKGEEVA